MTEYEVLAEGISPREGDYIDDQSVGVLELSALPEKLILSALSDPFSHQVYVKAELLLKEEKNHRGSPVVLKDLLNLTELCSKTLNVSMSISIDCWVYPDDKNQNIRFSVYTVSPAKNYHFHYLRHLLSFLNEIVRTKKIPSLEAEEQIAIGEKEEE